MEEDYATSDGSFQQAAAQMSAAPPAAGMAPYPLYGLPSLGTGEEGVPLWKKPMFCYAVGAAAGVGLGYLFFGWFKPKFMKSNPTRRTTRKPKVSAAEEES